MSHFCRTAATAIGSGGRLPFFTHQSATQISIWALSSSSCHTPSITKSTSCRLKHHLGRGGGRGGGGADNRNLEITSSQKPPLTACLKQLLRVSFLDEACDGLGIPVGFSHPSTILHPALDSRKLTWMQFCLYYLWGLGHEYKWRPTLNREFRCLLKCGGPRSLRSYCCMDWSPLPSTSCWVSQWEAPAGDRRERRE